MKTLYLECGMGAAGDMLTGALLELCPDREAFLSRMNALDLPGVHVAAEASVKCGITGTHIRVTVDGAEEESVDVPDHAHHAELHHHDAHSHGEPHEEYHHHDAHSHEEPHEEHHHHGDHEDHATHAHHHHTSLPEISALIDRLDLPEKVRSDAKAVYGIIAEAESRVHGRPVSEIHFHEVGTMDALADVVGVCLLMDILSPDQVLASPVHTGSGYVRCAHGVLPVPAPATALILSGVPSYGGKIRGELCTPTGAALLKHFVSRFGDRPVMSVRSVGYGMGKKDFEMANCVRAFLGDADDARRPVVKLECNLDDMTAEDIGFVMDELFASGAKDVYTQPAGMKKSRPGVLLSVVCLPEDADRLAEVIMKDTSTLGIRRLDMTRYMLRRKIRTVSTPYGDVRVKYAAGMGTERSKPEFEDVAALARQHGVSPDVIRRAARAAADAAPGDL